MNTFFRQKLTNKMIDLLEKVEDRKTRKEEDECFVLESPTILIIVGQTVDKALREIMFLGAFFYHYKDVWV